VAALVAFFPWSMAPAGAARLSTIARLAIVPVNSLFRLLITATSPSSDQRGTCLPGTRLGVPVEFGDRSAPFFRLERRATPPRKRIPCRDTTLRPEHSHFQWFGPSLELGHGLLAWWDGPTHLQLREALRPHMGYLQCAWTDSCVVSCCLEDS